MTNGKCGVLLPAAASLCGHAVGTSRVAGERDNFTLSIAQSERKPCGWYGATARMGNHVDEGDLTDRTFTPTSNQTFVP